MKYKTELHCHTSLVSKCAHFDVETMIDRYIELGYSSIVITDHFSYHTFEDIEDVSWEEKCEHFLSGYRFAKEYAKGRINVILGMEFRNKYNSNDYLVYPIDENFIKNNNKNDEENFLNMKIKDFVKICHENSFLVYQAHPFRNSMVIIKPDILDGIEILNKSKGHDSRNEIAKLWAEKYSLMVCGGSDCHNEGDEGRGGIETDFEIKTGKDLIRALKSDFSFLGAEDEK